MGGSGRDGFPGAIATPARRPSKIEAFPGKGEGKRFPLLAIPSSIGSATVALYSGLTTRRSSGSIRPRVRSAFAKLAASRLGVVLELSS